jgi:hypothetical protein
MPIGDELSGKVSIEDEFPAVTELESKSEEIKPEDAERITGGVGQAIPPGPPC